MGRGHDGTDAGFSFRDRRVRDAGAEHACFEELAGEVHGEFAVADDDGSDGRLASGCIDAADVEAEQPKFFFPETGIFPEILDALGFLLKDFEGCDAGCGDAWRMGRREQERPRTVVEEVDEIASSADIAAERADGFGESSHLNIDAAVDVEVVDGAAAVAAEDARGVGVVNHHDGAVFFGEIAESRQGADVAVHREDAVGDEQLFAGLVLHAAELGFGVGDVLVLEDQDFGAREAGSVDDGGVVELVGDDEVIFAEDRGNGAGVGSESGLEDHAGFDVFEASDFFFQLHVDLHGAGDRSHRTGADTVLASSFQSHFPQLGMRGEAEIIVGGEIDDFLAVEAADGGLLVFEHAQAEVGAFGLEIVELVGQVGERVGAGCGRHSSE